MADAVATRLVENTATHYVVLFTCISDGTGETTVTKVDKSTLVSALGIEPVSLDIEKIVFACNGMEVKIYWDHTTDDLAIALSGNGVFDFAGNVDGGITELSRLSGVKDPRSAGGTGDILFTTQDATSGDTYNVLMYLRKSAV